MNPLYRNDKAGQFPNSWYADTVDIPRLRPVLKGEHRADVAIVGAGYTGLWAARTLASRGYKVIVLDAHRAGFGASGRNGGQVSSGYNASQPWIAKKLGDTRARALWDLAEDGKAQLRDFISTHAPEAHYHPGVAHGAYTPAEAKQHHADAEYLAETYGYDQIDALDRHSFQALVKSRLYKGGTVDRGAGHIHPLRYALALARDAEAEGAQLFDRSEVIRITHGTPATVHTGAGRIIADHVLLAGNGYLPHIERQVASRVMPINSFIGATEPLGDRWRDVLAENIAVADDRFVVNYFRMSEDHRLLFGGRESYSIGYPRDIKTALNARMTSLFPQLRGTQMSHVWGGTLGITMTRLPSIQAITPNILSCAGFSGHGVALSGMAGRVAAEAIAGQAERFDLMSSLPAGRFPGGGAFRAPLLTLAMTWFSLRDRLGV